MGDQVNSCQRIGGLTDPFQCVYSLVLSDSGWQEAHWWETRGKSETQGATQWSRSSDSYWELAGPRTLGMKTHFFLNTLLVRTGGVTDCPCFGNLPGWLRLPPGTSLYFWWCPGFFSFSLTAFLSRAWSQFLYQSNPITSRPYGRAKYHWGAGGGKLVHLGCLTLSFIKDTCDLFKKLWASPWLEQTVATFI